MTTQPFLHIDDNGGGDNNYDDNKRNKQHEVAGILIVVHMFKLHAVLACL